MGMNSPVSMSQNISYSVVIRTLGNTGEKYKALLDSIESQTVKPEEVIVVIPHGYALDHELGYERVIHSRKGMVTQRAVGIETAKSDYILVVDDDIEFEADFVEKLGAFLKANDLDCVLPMDSSKRLLNDTTIDLSYPFSTRVKYAFTGRMFQSRRASKFLDVITATAGHKMYCACNQLDKCYYCQTGNFQCFFINTEKARKVCFEDESWLQDGTISTYAAYDDAIFFYHFYLLGYDIAYSLRSRYKHLDAAAGRPAKSKVEARRIRYYSIARNRTVFWYRYLLQPADSLKRRIKVLLGGLYSLVNYTLYTIAVNIHPKYWPVIYAMAQGYKEAFSIIKRNTLPGHGLKYRPE